MNDKIYLKLILKLIEDLYDFDTDNVRGIAVRRTSERVFELEILRKNLSTNHDFSIGKNDNE